MTGESAQAVLGAVAAMEDDGDRLQLEPSGAFVSTPSIEDVTDRALAYLEAGYAVHYAGPAGVGKTTLAFHTAAKLGQPVTLVHGDDEFGSSDLIGKDAGYRKYKLIDNFIHSVLKTEENLNTVWVDNRLTTACRNGYTLIYDEFTRSRPEANNALLSVLEERILNLPSLRSAGEGYLNVHPGFHAIFTSNPEEYAGVHKTQDALMDRLITIRLDHFDRATEIEITGAKSGLPRPEVETIVDIVRELREVGVSNSRPTIRACIAIARIVGRRKAHATWEDPFFRLVCRDVLSTDTVKVTRGGESLMPEKLQQVAREVSLRQAKRERDGARTRTGKERDDDHSLARSAGHSDTFGSKAQDLASPFGVHADHLPGNGKGPAQ